MEAKPIRHFGTIGIEDVFLECPDPPHFFPRSYFCNNTDSPMKNNCGSTGTGASNSGIATIQRPFVSSEIIGYIKERPEDFCVREIAKKSRLVEIMGEKSYQNLNDTEKRALQVADLVELNQVNNNQTVKTVSESTTHKMESTKGDGEQINSDAGGPQSISGTIMDKEATNTPPAELMADQTEAVLANEKQELSPLEIIKAVLGQVLPDHNKREEILAALQSLQERAREVIQPLKTNALKEEEETGLQNTLVSEDNNIIALPPIPKNFSHLEGDLANIDRGGFHRAFRLEFPLLKTEATPDQQVQVSIDDFFHDLIPFLQFPEEDLPRLYKFQKIGCVMDNASSNRYNNHNKKRKRDRQSPENDKTTPINNPNGNQHDESGTIDPILRLRPDLTKDERRPLHRMIQQKNRAFQTKTLSNYATTGGRDDDDAKADKIATGDAVSPNIATAILVHWDPGAQKRARQKKKSKQNKGDENKTSTDGTARDKAINADGQSPNNIYCVLRKREKEHLTAINNLCAAIKCRTGDVGLAGIKDMKAVTYQFCTIRNCRPGRLLRAVPALAEKGIGIGTIREVPTGVFLNNGDLEGNNFEIIIRGLQRVKVVESDGSSASATSTEEFIPCEKNHVQMMFERVKQRGFVNFYGEQRVGTPGDSSEVGVRTFDVGRAMLQGDFTKAIDLLMTGRRVTYRGVTENSDEAKVRRVWQETGGDPAATLKVFPKGENMPRERAVLKGLRRYGKSDPLAAIQCLPFNVRRFWINAYQSFVWNFMASARLRRFGSASPVVGDLFLEEDAATIHDVQVVDSSNLSLVSLSQVVLPLPGFGVRYPENEIGALYKEMLKKDSISFEKKGPDEGTAKGSYRHLIAKADNIQLEAVEHGEDPSFVISVKVSFDLPAGCYATMLLREMLLTTVARD